MIKINDGFTAKGYSTFAGGTASIRIKIDSEKEQSFKNDAKATVFLLARNLDTNNEIKELLKAILKEAKK